MLCVSEILLKHQEAECFADLIKLVKEGARGGERFLKWMLSLSLQILLMIGKIS